MSLFSDIGNAFSSAVSTVSNIASAVAPVLFPEATLALTAGNMISQAVGSGLQQAAGQLCKEAGMPKFLQDLIGQVINQVLPGLQQPSDPSCDQAAQNSCGHDFRDFASQIGQSIADIAKGLKRGGGDDDGSDNWLVAIAKAMGKVAGQHMKNVSELSNKLDTLSNKTGDATQDANNAQQAGVITNELQGETQMVSLLQNAFSNALKSLGDGLSTMARKG